MDENNFVPHELADAVKKKKFPYLQKFVSQYLKRELRDSWHHHLYYDILDNFVVQDHKTGLLVENFRRHHRKRSPNFRDGVTLGPLRNKNILVLSPRYHAKSSCFSINYPLYEIYKNPNVRILIVSGNEDIATTFVRAVMNQLENNVELRRDFGSLTPKLWQKKKWGEKALVVKRDTIEHSPTLSAVGVGGRLVSRRADIIICDDLIDINTARTKEARDKTQEWFENVLLPILDPKDGRLIVLGTAWYRDDIYDFLWRESKFDIRLKLKALIYHGGFFFRRQTDDEKTLESCVPNLPYHPHQEPLALNDAEIFSPALIKRYQLRTKLRAGTLWPDKWDYQTLMERKSNMSEASFNRQFLNEPGTEIDKVFRESLVNACSSLRFRLIQGYDNSRPANNYGHLIIAIGVDLAISKKTSADDSAIAVWGLDERRRRILLNLSFGKWSPEEVKNRIVEAYHNFSPVKIMVENIAYQDMMRQELEKENIPVEGFTTSASRKFNESTGIASISMLMEQGKFVLPKKGRTKSELAIINRLKRELLLYSPDQHAGDCLMASWFALEALKQYDLKTSNDRGYFESASMVEQLKGIIAPHRVVLLSVSPRVAKFSPNSYVHIYRTANNEQGDRDFILDQERFFIFVTRYSDLTCGYIFEKDTHEVVGKVEGDMSAIMCCNLLERVGHFFNNAQLVIDRNSEGDAIMMELSKRMYPNLLCLQPDSQGNIVFEEGFKISSQNLPLAVDNFRMLINNREILVRDDRLVKEMGELIDVNEDSLEMSFGTGQRIKTMATALWILENYETPVDTTRKKEKKIKKLSVPYTVFNY